MFDLMRPRRVMSLEHEPDGLETIGEQEDKHRKMEQVMPCTLFRTCIRWEGAPM